MNILKKISLAILGGVDVVVYIFTPILLSLIWVKLFGLYYWGDYLVYTIGLISSIFRGVKMGWMRE